MARYNAKLIGKRTGPIGLFNRNDFDLTLTVSSAPIYFVFTEIVHEVQHELL